MVLEHPNLKCLVINVEGYFYLYHMNIEHYYPLIFPPPHIVPVILHIKHLIGNELLFSNFCVAFVNSRFTVQQKLFQIRHVPCVILLYMVVVIHLCIKLKTCTINKYIIILITNDNNFPFMYVFTFYVYH